MFFFNIQVHVQTFLMKCLNVLHGTVIRCPRCFIAIKLSWSLSILSTCFFIQCFQFISVSQCFWNVVFMEPGSIKIHICYCAKSKECGPNRSAKSDGGCLRIGSYPYMTLKRIENENTRGLICPHDIPSL